MSLRLSILQPLLVAIESVSERIAEYNEPIEKLARASYPQVALLKQVKGVGTLIGLTFLLMLEIGAERAAAAHQLRRRSVSAHAADARSATHSRTVRCRL